MSTIQHDLFREAFDLRKARVQEKFDKAKAKFVEAVRVNVADAVSAASTIAELQHELSAWNYATRYVDTVGDRYRSNREAIENVVESLRHHIVVFGTQGPSTCHFANGVLHANLVGTRRALDELEYLLDHPAA
jgi:predicted TPR repeat methyltransferase